MRPSNTAHAERPADVALAVGDIVRAAVGAAGAPDAGPNRDDARRAFVVLLAPDAALGAGYTDVRVAAVSSDVAQAADRDLVLPAAAWEADPEHAPSLPASGFMVETWNSRPALAAALGRPVGRLSEAGLSALHAFVQGDDAGVARHGGRVGPPIASRDDVRFGFQVAEIRATAALSHAVYARLEELNLVGPATARAARRATGDGAGRAARPSPLFAPPPKWRRAARELVHPVPAAVSARARAFG